MTSPVSLGAAPRDAYVGPRPAVTIRTPTLAHLAVGATRQSACHPPFGPRWDRAGLFAFAMISRTVSLASFSVFPAMMKHELQLAARTARGRARRPAAR